MSGDSFTRVFESLDTGLSSPPSGVGGGAGQETSPNFSQGRKRRFVISQQPLGTAEKLGDSVNISLHTFKALCNEVRSLKDSMEMYNNRMSAIENKMTCVLDKCVEIFDKISYVENSLEKRPSEAGSRNVLFNSKLATKSQSLSGQMTASDEDQVEDPASNARMFTESSQIIRLNDEADHPSGSWLGNPALHEARVRVPIRSYELDNINITNTAPEKMALALLDHLFSRDTLAESNLTGKGKHKKKQLDPLFIFGIYCHLQYVFNIDESDWVKIRNNMDAKCRFLWTRKSKGLSLGASPVIKPPALTVELVSDSGYPGAEGMAGLLSCVGDEDGAKAESVYLDLPSDQLLGGGLGPVPVLVSAGTNVMLAGDRGPGDEEEDAV